ncbi:DUF7553 family protein [Halovivax cerinus]|uniref:Uncharacterized protein n=1 Tax=Halovivax cerinus TaxID=1487865 RepID=A0ABD5NQY1_9EURY|nr:hypothetical protein [Halovivax cerinus]
MDEDELVRARDRLRDAERDADGSVATDLRAVADDLEAIANGDQPVDHAVIDGYLNRLRQAEREADAGVEGDVAAAIEVLSTYRTGLGER